jgi:hypothetical protein
MPHIKKKNSNIKAWGPNVKQKIRGKITFINSRVKLKKFKHFTKKNQIENSKSKERGSNLKLRQNKRKNNISTKC